MTAPPAGSTDELPRWSGDGQSLLFVRGDFTNRDANATGSLYAVHLDGRVSGPIVRLGATGNYYGPYSWAWGTDWHSR